MIPIAIIIAFVAGQTPSGDACALLTPAEVGAVLGETIVPGQHLPGSHLTTICMFGPKTNPGIEDKKAVVTLMTAKSFETGKTPMQGITKTPVSGLGDEAYFVVTPGFGSGLDVRKGTAAFQIRVNGGKLTVAQEEEMEKALAKQAVARL